MIRLPQFILIPFILLSFYAKGSDTLYAHRLHKLKTEVDVTYHREVREYIQEFLNNSSKTSSALAWYEYYKPIIDSVFSRYDIPAEIGLLTLGVSWDDAAYNDDNGNAGVWAMPYSLARMYDLKINTYVDERRDVVKATDVTARYLRELKVIYNNWLLCLAAYTGSTASVNKAIRMGSNTFDYWKIYNYLPAESQRIVPQYIGAVYIYHFHKEHGIAIGPKIIEIPYDTLSIGKWMSFSAMAPVLHTDADVLRRLNPVFRKDVVPFAPVNYTVKLPSSSRAYFAALNDIKYEPYNTNPYLEDVPELENKNIPIRKADSTASQTTQAAPTTQSDTVIHEVLKGEGLGVIAQKYNVKVDDIKKWNGMKNNYIFPGKRLIIVRKENN